MYIGTYLIKQLVYINFRELESPTIEYFGTQFVPPDQLSIRIEIPRTKAKVANAKNNRETVIDIFLFKYNYHLAT